MPEEKKPGTAYQNKQVQQYSNQGINLRDLLTQQVGGNLNEENFRNYIGNQGVGRRGQRQLMKGFKQMMANPNRDYMMDPNGSGFNVFENNTPYTGSGQGKGNAKGLGLGDFIGLGDNLSRLSGFASTKTGDYKSGKERLERGQQALTSMNNPAPTSMELPKYQASSFTPIGKPPVRTSTVKSKGSGSGAVKSNTGTTSTGLIDPSTKNPQGFNPLEFQRRKDMYANDPSRRQTMINEDKLKAHRKAFEDYATKQLKPLGVRSSFPDPGMRITPMADMNAAYYAKDAGDIYETMVREGLKPDPDEVINLVQDREIQNILKGEREAAMTSADAIIAAITLGKINFSVLRKFPNIGKWLQSRGANMIKMPGKVPIGPKALPGGPKINALPGAKSPKLLTDPTRERTIQEMSSRMAEGFEKGGKISVKKYLNC